MDILHKSTKSTDALWCVSCTLRTCSVLVCGKFTHSLGTSDSLCACPGCGLPHRIMWLSVYRFPVTGLCILPLCSSLYSDLSLSLFSVRNVLASFQKERDDWLAVNMRRFTGWPAQVNPTKWCQDSLQESPLINFCTLSGLILFCPILAVPHPCCSPSAPRWNFTVKVLL